VFFDFSDFYFQFSITWRTSPERFLKKETLISRLGRETCTDVPNIIFALKSSTNTKQVYHLFLTTSASCHGPVMNFTGRILFVLGIFSFSTLLYLDFVFIYFPVVFCNSLVALLKRMNGQFFSFFFLQKMLRKCEVCCSEKLV